MRTPVVDLDVVARMLDERAGVLGLPVIVNRKTVDPTDTSSTKVIQIECAMGTAIEAIDGSRAMHVPRSRFRPVKTTNELTLVRSDLFPVGEAAGHRIGAAEQLTHSAQPLVPERVFMAGGSGETAAGAGLDILIANAGITKDGLLMRMKDEDWDAVIETNLTSLFNVTKQVVADMVERGWGRIINISSVNGEKGQAGQTNYSAAKAGMHGFSMALAQELATKGVTVNTVSPGYIGTDMVNAIRPDVLEKIVATVPVKRLGKPAEIASIIAWMASEDGGYTTGADFAVNGGLHMG